MWFKKHWWKAVAIGCLLYSFIAGLLVPLSPAIYSLSDISLDANKNTPIVLKGYHTSFSKEGTDVWFSFQGPEGKLWKLQADSIEVVDAETIKIFPVLAPGTPDLVADVWVSDASSFQLGMASSLHLEGADSGLIPPSYQPKALTDVSKPFYFPFRYILEESIRNLFFHVPMWFTMIILLLLGVIYSILFLRTNLITHDIAAEQFNKAALLFGILGIATGSLWAKNTWGDWWTNDAKLNGAGIGMLIYLSWFVLRSGVEEPIKRARISSVYSVFAFPIFIVLIFVLPRINDSLHPGNGGNPGFNKYDLDTNMRAVFYPAVLGWILTGIWIARLLIRYAILKFNHENNHHE